MSSVHNAPPPHASSTSSEDANYMILRPEKARLWDIMSLVILGRRRRLNTYRFVEAGVSSDHHPLGEGYSDDQWVVALTLLIQKALLAIKTPMAWAGYVIEYIINLLALNGGLLKLLWHLVTGSLVIPKRDAANFRSIIGHIDGRVDLFKTSSLINYFPGQLMDPHSTIGDVNVLDLSMLASKIAYENPAYIENVVSNHWKMHFVGFFNCWNKFLNEKATQAFIFCNKEEDADLIVLAFRGTETFNAQDWSTDVDLSWLSMGLKMGHVHLGFLKALGLQDETNIFTGFPKSYDGPSDKPVAYYVLREALTSLLKQHQNAKILVTGHSLGGALAAIFPSLLAFHDQKDILDSMYGVMTYGQPRVGDIIFGGYMETMVRLKYHRMVYRFDLVPRVPFDLPPIALFKHFGTCIYYKGWYNALVVAESPNPNYFSGLYTVQMYLFAWLDLFRALFIGFTQGQDYKEGYVSILYRASGLVLPGIASHSPRDYVNSGRLSKKITDNKMMV